MDAPLPSNPHHVPAVEPAVNGVAAVNGVHGEHVVNGVLDDPTKPVSNTVASELKIDIDLPEQESDARHEPLPQAQSPEEHAHALNGVNGTNGDVSMHDADVNSPVTTPGGMPPASSNGASTSHTSPQDPLSQDQDEDQPPPAKRPRILSDADQASFTHSATPPPASSGPAAFNGATSAPPTSSGARATLDMVPSTPLRSASLTTPPSSGPRWTSPPSSASSTLQTHPNLIPTPENPRYSTSDDFIADVHLIFKNCLLFNGADHPISAKAQHLEEVFEKQIKNLPAPAEVKPPPIVKKVATPPPPAPVVKKAQPPPTCVHVDAFSRPKREIHPPPPKDLPYADLPKKRKTRRVKDDGTAEQLKFCSNLLNLLHRKQHYTIASPFYEPVDHVALDIPTYPKIVKKPMDLSTMRKKLDNHEYPNALKFYDDFKLMIRNCFAFNPAGNLVNQAGIELQRLFDEKWQGLPPLHEVSDDDDEEDEEESEDENAQRIAQMESQIELMRGNIRSLKEKPKEKKKKERRDKGPIASSSKSSSSSKQVKGLSNKKPKGKKPMSDNDVLTFEQKKDLSEAIAGLDGAKLERVIKIIHEGVPEIKDSTEEIELEIDMLPTSVLTKLYNFVLRPLRAPATKRNRTGKGGGTGGLKRKSMDEDVEAEKIRQLETRMALFEQGGSAAVAAQMGHSSDSSSGSDSSGSDSE
ncbi:Bromodomain-containing protein [Mycena sanguinolenta]|uniref:Bromodomain-containing protein n=1 Tax=Mycena sanguinolenta TaxID=230812 RepID=A0A8H7CKU8_9AGAR|nr:Bromodomain-containing protein [Mycena sanguinolenta]